MYSLHIELTNKQYKCIGKSKQQKEIELYVHRFKICNTTAEGVGVVPQMSLLTDGAATGINQWNCFAGDSNVNNIETKQNEA